MAWKKSSTQFSYDDQAQTSRELGLTGIGTCLFASTVIWSPSLSKHCECTPTSSNVQSLSSKHQHESYRILTSINKIWRNNELHHGCLSMSSCIYDSKYSCCNLRQQLHKLLLFGFKNRRVDVNAHISSSARYNSHC